MIADQWRLAAQSDFELYCAYRLAESLDPRAVDDDPFHPHRSDELRALRLSIQATRSSIPDTGRQPVEEHLRAAFERGDDQQLIARFQALDEASWPAEVEALLHRRDPTALRFWIIRADAMIRLRQIRARSAGLVD